MLGAWPGKCDEDCEVGSCLPMDPGNDGDGEGTLRPSFRDDAWPKSLVKNMVVRTKYFQIIDMMKLR